MALENGERMVISTNHFVALFIFFFGKTARKIEQWVIEFLLGIVFESSARSQYQTILQHQYTVHKMFNKTRDLYIHTISIFS